MLASARYTVNLVTESASTHPWEANFVENMTRRRKVLGMSQSALAKALAARGLPFHQPTVQRIENGERPVRLNEAVHIVQVLDMGQPGQLGLDVALLDPQGDGSLIRSMLADALDRSRVAVAEAEGVAWEVIDEAFSAVSALVFTLRIYEQDVERGEVTLDQQLVDMCRQELERFEKNTMRHLRPLLGGDDGEASER